MLSLKPRPKTSPSPISKGRSRRRFSPWQLIGASVVLGIMVLAGAAFAFQNLGFANAAWVDHDGNRHMNQRNIVSTIGGLNKISMIGSTETIINANGQSVKVDANPYDVTAAPFSSGNLHTGDLIVNNFGAMG